MRKVYQLVLLLFLFGAAGAQHLQPGFDRQEYIALMKVSAQFGDSAYAASIPPPSGYRMVYRSPVMGLDNRWDLWVDNKGVGIISIRGTTVNEVSWLANFYAAMAPAQGELRLSETETFSYHLAAHPRAAVHTGWLVGTAFLAKDMLPKIDSCARKGMAEFAIIGHSQGGAIAYLLTAYLHWLQQQQKLPAGLRFKTYCSAAPKPGNLYFAYAYEALTQEGWAYNVVNSADWVPEMPVSIQTLSDFNNVSPFVQAPVIIKRQKFPRNLALRYAYGRLNKPSRKAARNYRRYLGSFVAKSVKKNLDEFKEPMYDNSFHYVRTGNTIVLQADDAYNQQFPQEKTKIFVNHFHAPYLYLANRLVVKHSEEQTDTEVGPPLEGAWRMLFLAGHDSELDELYPVQKPSLLLEGKMRQFSGSTGCNSFRGLLSAQGDNIRFPQNMALTRMLCPGRGEQVFLEALRTVDRYAVEGNTLSLLRGDAVVLRFERSEE